MTRRTPEQQIAYHQDKIRRIRAAESRRKRNERTRRLCASAGRIESIAGLELDEELATEIGRWLGVQAQDPESRVAIHLAARAAAGRASAEGGSGL